MFRPLTRPLKHESLLARPMFRPLIRPLKHESLLARPEIDALDVLGTIVDCVQIGAGVVNVIGAAMIVVGSVLPPHRGQPVHRRGDQLRNSAQVARDLAKAVADLKDRVEDLVESRQRRAKRRTE